MTNFLVAILLAGCINIFPQDNLDIYNNANSDSIIYPKADIHIGVSSLKGFYIGSIIQTSGDWAFEISFGSNVAIGEPFRTVGFGANLYIEKFMLNLSYIYFEQFEKYISHNLALSIQLFSIEDPGFHLIGGLGAFGEIKRFHSDEPESFGVLFNLALGFTIF